MKIDNDDVKEVKNVLWPNEKIMGTVKQRRVGPGGSVTVPTSVVITDQRLIILNRATLGIRHDYEVIPYNSISSVRLEEGIISSSVFIRVQGYDTDKGLLQKGRQEGEIDGLRNKDAKELANFINLKMQQRSQQQAPVPSAPPHEDMDTNVGGYMFCNKCGAKNSASASFCSKCGAKLGR